jgi:hypothetical protein
MEKNLRFGPYSFYFRDREIDPNGSFHGFEGDILELIKVLFFFKVNVTEPDVKELILRVEHEFSEEEQSHQAEVCQDSIRRVHYPPHESGSKS